MSTWNEGPEEEEKQKERKKEKKKNLLGANIHICDVLDVFRLHEDTETGTHELL